LSDVGKEIVEAAEKFLAEHPPERPAGCECAVMMQTYGMPVICRACDEDMAAAAKAGGWTYGGGV
jgi:hypothetical protein